MKTAMRSALSHRSSSARSINTRRLEVFASKEPARLHPATPPHSRKSTRHLARRSASLSWGYSFRAEGGHVLDQLLVRTSRGLNSRFVVGAPRHSAAPGSQSIGAAGYGSILSSFCYSSPMLSKAQLREFQCKTPCPRARPNPSIERTATGLALPGAQAYRSALVQGGKLAAR